MLDFLKRMFLFLIVIISIITIIFLFWVLNQLYITGELQNEIIPKIKYTITDSNLLFPPNDFHKERRYMLWNQKTYFQLLHNLKSLEDGYIVSDKDFENDDPNNPFYRWNDVLISKHCGDIFDLLIFGDLTQTQKQSILDFYKMKNIAYFEIAKEIVAIKTPQSIKDFEQIREKIDKLISEVGFPEYYANPANYQ